MAMSGLQAAAKALKEIQMQMRNKAGDAGFLSEADVAEWITETRREENRKKFAEQEDANEDDALAETAERRLADSNGIGTDAPLKEVMDELGIRGEEIEKAAEPVIE